MTDKKFYQKVHKEKRMTDVERTSKHKINKILKFIENNPNSVILDIGCGDGSITVLIEKQAKSKFVFGADISLEACIGVRRRGLKAIVCNFEYGLPFKNEAVDVIFCGSVIEHLIHIDEFFDEIKRILKPNGYCILTTPNLGWMVNRAVLLFGLNPFFTEPSNKYEVSGFWAKKRMDVPAGHVRLFTLRALISLLTLNNFIIDNIEGAKIVEPLIMQRLKLNLKINFILEYIDTLFSLFPSLSAELILKIHKKPQASDL